jgi:hypothetical protein
MQWSRTPFDVGRRVQRNALLPDRNSIGSNNCCSASVHNSHCCHSEFAVVAYMTVNVMHKTQAPQTTLVASHRHAHRHAFSSGRAMTCKRQAQRRQQIRVNTSRGHNPVLAVAASDVGTKAVQAIKKSVGGDVFVAGDVRNRQNLHISNLSPGRQLDRLMKAIAVHACRR